MLLAALLDARQESRSYPGIRQVLQKVARDSPSAESLIRRVRLPSPPGEVQMRRPVSSKLELYSLRFLSLV